MLDGMRVHWQTISVPFDYPVYFTRDVFAVENRDLIEAVTRLEARRRHRLLVVIDAGVAAAWPSLSSQIALRRVPSRAVDACADRRPAASR